MKKQKIYIYQGKPYYKHIYINSYQLLRKGTEVIINNEERFLFSNEIAVNKARRKDNEVFYVQRKDLIVKNKKQKKRHRF